MLSPGDNVTVLMKKSMGYTALFLGYVFPFILVITVLIILAALPVTGINCRTWIAGYTYSILSDSLFFQKQDQ